MLIIVQQNRSNTHRKLTGIRVDEWAYTSDVESCTRSKNFLFGTKVLKEYYCGKENNVDDIGL